MVARPADLEVADIRDADPQKRLRSVRCLKNAIIGNNSKKKEYLQAGAIPCLLEVMTAVTWEDGCEELLVQSCAALGSFACGIPTGVEEIITGGGISCLTSTLDYADMRVVEAGVRSLKLICIRGPVPPEMLLQPPILNRLVALLESPRHEIGEAVTSIFARICQTAEAAAALNALCSELRHGDAPACKRLLKHSMPVLEAAALDALCSVLRHGNAIACKQLLEQSMPVLEAAALDALCSVLRHGDVPACKQLLEQSIPVLEVLMRMMKDRHMETRLMAASCCTYMCSTLGPDDLRGGEDIKRSTLAALHRLLSAGPSIAESVPPLLARIIEDSEELQKTALDAGAIQRLASFLSNPGCSDMLKEGVFRALANLCMKLDEGRKQVIDAKVLMYIVAALGNSNYVIRSSSALCIMALTRSVRALRSNLLESEGGAKMAEALCKLLQDDNTDVQVNATAAVCNLVLEFSSVKVAVLEKYANRGSFPSDPTQEAVFLKGGLQILAQHTNSMVPALRLHSTWALRNMAYKSDTTVRHSLMGELKWSSMRALLNDEDEQVQEQAICTLRNLCMDSPNHITAVFDWAGADLLAILEEKLDPCRNISVSIAEHAIYTVVNILTGSDAHKDAVLSSNLPAMLIHYLRGSQGTSELRLPAIWCIINFTWPDSSTGLPGRKRKLLELGVDEYLKGLLQLDPTLDVRERVKTALEQLQ
eukprot:gene26108-11823_t